MKRREIAEIFDKRSGEILFRGPFKGPRGVAARFCDLTTESPELTKIYGVRPVLAVAVETEAPIAWST